MPPAHVQPAVMHSRSASRQKRPPTSVSAYQSQQDLRGGTKYSSASAGGPGLPPPAAAGVPPVPAAAGGTTGSSSRKSFINQVRVFKNSINQVRVFKNFPFYLQITILYFFLNYNFFVNNFSLFICKSRLKILFFFFNSILYFFQNFFTINFSFSKIYFILEL
jgi:hypothetical protein